MTIINYINISRLAVIVTKITIFIIMIIVMIIMTITNAIFNHPLPIYNVSKIDSGE